MIRALLWKDYRLNRLVLFIGVLLLVGPFVLAVGSNYYHQWRTGAICAWPDMLVHSGIMSLAFSLITIGLLGGNAVAGERTDRSTEFLAYLPPTRRRLIASKALLALSALLMIWLVNLLVMYAVAPLTGELLPHVLQNRSESVCALVCTGVFLFGGSWLASCMLRSCAIALGIGVVGPVALILVLELLQNVFGYPDLEVGWWYALLSLILGLACFLAGICYYLRRLDP